SVAGRGEWGWTCSDDGRPASSKACGAPTDPPASGSSGRRRRAWRSTSLSRTSGRRGSERERESAEPLLLQAINLDDHTILDDHTDLAMPDVLDGQSDPLQIEIAGEEGAGGPPIFLGGQRPIRHDYLPNSAKSSWNVSKTATFLRRPSDESRPLSTIST